MNTPWSESEQQRGSGSKLSAMMLKTPSTVRIQRPFKPQSIITTSVQDDSTTFRSVMKEGTERTNTDCNGQVLLASKARSI